MKRNTILMSAAALLTLIGCGGGGGTTSPDTVTGKFRDTYVAGLTYKCSSGKKDLTNTAGEYTCNVGDTVEFLLGTYSLGPAIKASNGVITPKILYPTNPIAETNVAQLLLSINESNGTGIITIPDNFKALNDVKVPPTAATFDNNMTIELQSAGITQWVSEADAQRHLQETYTDVLTDLIKGQTFYSTIYTEMNTLESLAFNSDATKSTWTELVGGSCTGSGNITIEGMNIKFTPTTDSCADNNDIGSTEILTVTEIKDNYILVAMGESSPQRLYFDEDKAREYFLPDTTTAKKLLAGKSVYILSEKNDASTQVLDKATFSSDMSTLTWLELIGPKVGEGETDGLSVNGMVLTIRPPDASDGIETLTITEIKDDYLLATYREDDDGKVYTDTIRIYFNEAKARAYLENSTSINLKTLLAGKTLYSTIYDQIKTLESWSFNADASSSRWTELVGGDCTGSGTTSIHGMNISYTATSDSCWDEGETEEDTETLTVTEIKDDYISIAVGDSTPQRLFFTEEKAREFYITNAVKNYFTGQTRYFANINGATGVRTYNTDGTYTGTVNSSSVGGTYTISGDTLTLTNTGSDRILALTHQGYAYDGEQFSITITNTDGSGGTTTTYQYRSATDRDAAKAQYIQDHS